MLFRRGFALKSSQLAVLVDLLLVRLGAVVAYVLAGEVLGGLEGEVVRVAAADRPAAARRARTNVALGAVTPISTLLQNASTCASNA